MECNRRLPREWRARQPGGRMIRAAFIALTLSGCAMGRVSASGEVSGFAIGRAKLEHCIRAEGKPQCNRISGGAMSSGFGELVESALGAVAAWWGAGA